MSAGKGTLRGCLWSSALLAVMLSATRTPAQVVEVPGRPGGISAPPVSTGNPLNNSGLTNTNIGASLNGPGLGNIVSYNGSAGGYAGGTSASKPFVPDAQTPHVQAVLDRLFRDELKHIPAVEKTQRNRP